MSKFIVVVFLDKAKAYEGLRALRALGLSGARGALRTSTARTLVCRPEKRRDTGRHGDRSRHPRRRLSQGRSP
jgi:hypothetical protein